MNRRNIRNTFFIGLLVLGNIWIANAQKNAFLETFSTRNSQWLNFEGNNLLCVVTENDYFAHNKSAAELSIRTPFYFSRLDPIKLELNIMSNDKSRGFNGFYIRTDKELFKFYYSTQGYVRAVKINLATNKQDTIQPQYAVDKINMTGYDINNLRFSIKKDEINFYINKKKVASAPFVAKKITETGLILAAKNAMRILDMKLSPRPRIYKINFVENPIQNAYKQPLNKNINTDNDEFAPVVSADGKWMFFVSMFRPESFDMDAGRRSQDIYFSENFNGTWTQAQRLGPPLNNEFANSVVGLSLDKKTMILSGTYMRGTYYGDDVLYQSTFSDAKGWSFPEPIVITEYENRYPYRSFCISNDRKVIIMSGKQGESEGESDLYVSFLNPDNTYSKPKSLGKVVNTGGFENAPFLAADNKTLYFSSNGHVGFGKGDIFVTKRLDETWESWSIPLNLGASVNSPFDDSYFTVDGIGKTGYVCSPDGPNHEFNIYEVSLGEGAKPEPVVVVTGKVINMKTKRPAQTTVATYEDQDRIPSETTKSDEMDGQYVFTLKQGSDYELKVLEQGFIPISETIKLSNESGLRNVEKDIYIFPKEVGEKVRVRNLTFGTGEFELNEQVIEELDMLVKLMYQNPNLKVSIEGHTDNIGSSELNLRLSKERAKQVAFYLYTQGLEAQRLTYKGFGESKPIADNKTVEGRNKNRRVEYVIY